MRKAKATSSCLLDGYPNDIALPAAPDFIVNIPDPIGSARHVMGISLSV